LIWLAALATGVSAQVAVTRTAVVSVIVVRVVVGAVITTLDIAAVNRLGLKATSKYRATYDMVCFSFSRRVEIEHNGNDPREISPGRSE
jgi:hypothetical protein